MPDGVSSTSAGCVAVEWNGMTVEGELQIEIIFVGKSIPNSVAYRTG
jgi:hypothetical protein